MASSLVPTYVRDFVTEVRHASLSAKEEARLLGSTVESTVLHVFLEELKNLVERLESSVDALAADPEAAANAELALARHEAEDVKEENVFLRDALNAEEVRLRELLFRFSHREQLFADLKAHVMRQQTHAASGLSASYAAVPFALLESLDAEVHRVDQQSQQRVQAATRSHEVTMRKQRDSYEQRLQAKEKEIIQMQMRFRDALTSLQAAHAQEVSRLAEDRRDLRVLLTDTEQIAMQRAEAYCGAKYDEKLAEARRDMGGTIAKLQEELSVHVQERSEAQAKIETLEDSLHKAEQRVSMLQAALQHVFEIELPNIKTPASTVAKSTSSEVDALMSQHADTQQRLVQLELDMSNLNEEHAKKCQLLEAEVSHLQSQLTAARAESQNKEGLLRDAVAQRVQLNSQLQNYMKTELQLQTEVEFLRRAAGGAAADAFKKLLEQAEADHDSRIVELTEGLQTAQEKLQEALNSKIDLADRLRLSEAAFHACDVERVENRTKCNKLEIRLHEMKAQFDSVQDKLLDVQRALMEERSTNAAAAEAKSAPPAPSTSAGGAMLRVKSTRQLSLSHRKSLAPPTNDDLASETPRAAIKRFQSSLKKATSFMKPPAAGASASASTFPASPKVSGNRDSIVQRGPATPRGSKGSAFDPDTLQMSSRDDGQPSTRQRGSTGAAVSFATFDDTAPLLENSLLSAAQEALDADFGASTHRAPIKLSCDEKPLSVSRTDSTLRRKSDDSSSYSMNGDSAKLMFEVPDMSQNASSSTRSRMSSVRFAGEGGGHLKAATGLYVFPAGTPGDVNIALNVQPLSPDGSQLTTPTNAGNQSPHHSPSRGVASSVAELTVPSAPNRSAPLTPTRQRAATVSATAPRAVSCAHVATQCELVSGTQRVKARIINGAATPISVDDRRTQAILRRELVAMHKEISFLELQVSSLHEQHPLLSRSSTPAIGDAATSPAAPAIGECSRTCEQHLIELEPIPFTDVSHRKEVQELNMAMGAELERRRELLHRLQQQLQRDVQRLGELTALGSIVGRRASSPAVEPSQRSADGNQAVRHVPTPRAPSAIDVCVVPLSNAMPPSKNLLAAAAPCDSSRRTSSPAARQSPARLRLPLQNNTMAAVEAMIAGSSAPSPRDCGGATTTTAAAHPPKRPSSARPTSGGTHRQTWSSSGGDSSQLLGTLRGRIQKVIEPVEYFCLGYASSKRPETTEPLSSPQRQGGRPSTAAQLVTRGPKWTSASMSLRCVDPLDAASRVDAADSGPTMRVVSSAHR